jgi:hypothetical protein
MERAASLEDGQCGLSDGSNQGDWRLPTVDEWLAFQDRRFSDPALSNAEGLDKWSEGDAFSNVQFGIRTHHAYWSISPCGPTRHYRINMDQYGSAVCDQLDDYILTIFWPVREGN